MTLEERTLSTRAQALEILHRQLDQMTFLKLLKISRKKQELRSHQLKETEPCLKKISRKTDFQTCCDKMTN